MNRSRRGRTGTGTVRGRPRRARPRAAGPSGRAARKRGGRCTGRTGGNGEGPALAGRPFSIRVSDGTRTRDILDHNQVLYQLSYTHRDRSFS